MTHSNRLWSLAITLVFMLVLGLSSVQAQSEGEPEETLIAIVAASDTFDDWLPNYPNYIAYAYRWEDGSNNWYVVFYAEDEEWLGYANINADTGEIFESFAPIPLPQDVFQELKPRIQTLVLDDPEVQAMLVDLTLWDVYTEYNRFDAVWEVNLYRGTESIVVQATIDENDYFTIVDIFDPNELSAEEAEQVTRDEAISLAYSAENAWQALDGHDNWKTYVENQGGTRWAVIFEADGEELLYVLVDVATNTVLESSAGG